MKSSSISRYRFKKLIKMLKEKKGRGTELISLYIPPGRNIFEVGNYLRHEQDQAGNIKDKLTRKNVQASIEKLIQYLKLYKKTPPNGLVLFCGAIPQGPVRGTEKIEMYALEPPEPVRSFMYICDQRFYVEPLEEMVKEKDVYGLLVLDRGGGAIAILRGANYSIVSKVSSDVPPKHSAGGWSQRRFERIREEKVHEFFKKFGEAANKALIPYLNELKGIIIGGPGDARELFEQGNYLDYRLKSKVIANIPTSYSGEGGLRELIERSKDVLKGAALVKEKEAVDKIFRALARNPNMVAYGLREVLRSLMSGAAEMVVVLNDLDYFHVKRTCKGCSFQEEKLLKEEELKSLESSEPCPNCESTTFEVEKEEIIDYISTLAESTSAEVFVISSETEWGEQLRALGGIAALLRYETS